MRRFALTILISATLGPVAATAQPQPPSQPENSVGSVGIQDATVAGALEITSGRALLVGSTTVTAKDHTAEVELTRGGTLRVCATSGLHLTAGKLTNGTQPLLLALDRGAIEVHMAATTSDAVMTPDLRFSLASDGPLDLRLRVIRNGDTCVENRGAKAPTLLIADQFGEATYSLRPGQHVLFEHGSLKEVVDNESSPCGCPPDPSVSLAEALLTPGASTTAPAAQQAAAQHPFPAAVSQGLAPGGEVPQATPGVVHAQVAATLSYSSTNPALDTPQPPASSTTPLPPPTPATPHRGVLRSIGHFFKRVFTGG